MKKTLRDRILLSVAMIGAAATPSLAQTPQPQQYAAAESEADVVITARRQNERALDVPIPVTVISGRALEEKGAYTLEDVQRQAPSFVASNSNPRNSSVGIRGIGISSASDGLDTSVGFYFDNVYLGRPGMALQDLIDIERFEILRGPQGTLFGRNTSAGVVHVITRKPSFAPSTVVETSLGNYNYNQIKFSTTGPLVDGKLAYRLTGFNTHRDGVLENTKTGIAANSVGRSGGRLQFLYTPAENFSLRLIGEYSIEDDTCCVSVLKSVMAASQALPLPANPGVTIDSTTRTLDAFAALGYYPTANLKASRNNSLQNMLTDQHGFSGEAEWDLGWADLTSISAYRYWHFSPLQDSDGTPLDIIQVNVAQTKDDQFSQEFRLASKPGRFNWQAGLYVFHQELTDHYILNQFGFDASAFYTRYRATASPAQGAVSIAPGSQYIGDTYTESDAAAVFGQANYDLTDKFTLTAGLRYTKDRRTGKSDTSTVGTPYGPTTIAFNHDEEVEGENTSYLISGSYKPTEDSLLYLSYSTGYKAAGLNLNSPVTVGTSIVVQPEEVKNWEIGWKQALFDNRATIAVSAFSMDLSGLQANIAPPGVRSYLANVGDVKSDGVEVEGTWRVTDELSLSANGSYTSARYESYPNAPCAVGQTAPCDLSGRPLFQAPKYTSSATARYETDIADGRSLYALAQYAYRSEHYGNVQLDEGAKIDGYGMLNARVGAKFDDGKYDLALWVDNATDEQYFLSLGTASITGAGAYGYSGRLGTPRTFGATLRATF